MMTEAGGGGRGEVGSMESSSREMVGLLPEAACNVLHTSNGNGQNWEIPLT